MQRDATDRRHGSGWCVVITAAGGEGQGHRVVTGSATGTLTDAAIGGVSYATSSGVTGTTAADGTYKYNPGDTVTFKLGGLTLGTVTATGIITPIELAGGSAAKLQNLLVLFQSLDSDGNTANGITIPAAAATAVSASVNLAGATSTFATDATIQAVMTAGGISGAPVTAAAADAHFKSQLLVLLASNIWVNQSVDGSDTQTFVIRTGADGVYSQAEARAIEEGEGGPGAEYGTLSVTGYSTAGFSLVAAIDEGNDGNGTWGASDLQACNVFRVTPDSLITGSCETDEVNTFRKMDNDPAGIVGAWAIDGGAIGAPSIYFFANGRFLLVIGSANVSQGRYALASGSLTLNYDGGDQQVLEASLSGDAKTLSISFEGPIAFTRVSK